MALAPMTIRYRTDRGDCYVYDVRSGEVLRVSDEVYRILPDYHILTDDEMVEKHRGMSEESVRDAISQLDEMQSRNVFCDHIPERTARPEAALCDEKTQPMREFIASHRRLLTLELTHQCNLACKYCAFGEHYHQSRDLSTESMSFDTAKQAVAHFLRHKSKEAGIGFYGGEPLLEFDLIKRVVFYAESLARESDMEVRFSMTTNGTLLTDKRIHFLAEHKFSVMVSLDGDKKSHDRHRVFKSKADSEGARGSFDVVTRNMRRFVELYPDYPGRGIILTLTATSDVGACEDFVASWKTWYPTIIASLVSPLPEDGEGDALFGVGPCQGGTCGDGFCGRYHRLDDEADGDKPASREAPTEVPEFVRWGDEWSASLGSCRRSFLAKLCSLRHADMTRSIRDGFPINKSLLDGNVRDIHKRQLPGPRRLKPPVTRMSCFPGATRTYCSSKGVLYSCEKTEFGDFFALGSAAHDVDADKAYDLAEMLRLHCECANCVANGFCGLCPAQATVSKDDPRRLDGFALRKTCQRFASEAGLAARLREYTEIMEANPDVLDWIYEEEHSSEDDWLNYVRVLTAKPARVKLPVEELQEFV